MLAKISRLDLSYLP